MRDPLALRHFRRWAVALDTRPFLAEIEQAGGLSSPSKGVRAETETVCLRSSDKAPEPGVALADMEACRPGEFRRRFSRVAGFLEAFAAGRAAALQQAMIVRLSGDGILGPPIDGGTEAAIHDRYHLVLQSVAGSRLAAGAETVIMQQGELWWLDNKLTHEARNTSGDTGIHVVFDLLPNAPA